MPKQAWAPCTATPLPLGATGKRQLARAIPDGMNTPAAGRYLRVFRDEVEEG